MQRTPLPSHALNTAHASPRHIQPTWRQLVMTGLLGAMVLLLPTVLALAEMGREHPPVATGMLLVAHPSMEDPNFHHTVVLIAAHGQEGTMGFVLNRPTDILLSQALPNLTVLQGTTYRLFAGGPVSATSMAMLTRLAEPLPDLQPVFSNIYMGGTPEMLEQIVTRQNQTEAFRIFAGMAGWAPGQLAFELRQGAWVTLSPDATAIFDKDPATLWTDSLQRLQVPIVISQ